MSVIKRIGKCSKCNHPMSETKTFDETVDMFGPMCSPSQISRNVVTQIRQWGETPLTCEDCNNG